MHVVEFSALMLYHQEYRRRWRKTALIRPNVLKRERDQDELNEQPPPLRGVPQTVLDLNEEVEENRQTEVIDLTSDEQN